MTRLPSSPRANALTPDRRPNVVLVRGGRDDSLPPTATPDSSGLIGKVISDRYFIERLLGEGGMGKVYLAQHLLMHKRFAVKVLRPGMTRKPEAVARFEREAMAAAHIEHPNVASATDFGKLDDGSFFLVLEYIEGIDLFDVIGLGTVDAERALHITHQIASALARAHALGIVHRDLKPENVMLVERDGDPNFVKVLDFGIAKLITGTGEGPHPTPQNITQVGAVFGTPEYMAPEQALGLEVDHRADLYALGVLLFEMLSGVRPYQSDGVTNVLTMKISGVPPTVKSKNPAANVPPAVEEIVRRLLERHADLRYQNAHQLLDAIEASGSWTAKTRGSVRPAALTSTGISRIDSGLLSTLDARKSREVVRILGLRARSVWAAVSVTTIRVVRAAQRIHARWPEPLRRALPLELLAGIAAGLLLTLVFVLATRGAAGPATSSAPSVEVDATGAATDWSAQPLLLRTDEARGVDARPGSSTNASGRTVQPKAPARRKSGAGLTDFGGRL
jgi:serine/threonine protein kinase